MFEDNSLYLHRQYKYQLMYFTLGLKNLPFEPDCNQIIFIEGKHDEETVQSIERHFHRIKECFKSRGFDFCYIPYLKHDLTSGERLHYNVPYAKSSREADFMVNDNFILDYMVHPENREEIPPSLLYFHPDCWDYAYSDADAQFRGVSIIASSFESDEKINNLLDSILQDIESHREPPIRFHKVSVSEPEGDEDGVLYRNDDDWDYDFDNLDDESITLMQEIEERIEKLRQKGLESYLIESMFKNRKQKLSRLCITKDYQIYLPDYFGKGINLTPLPKAVFLLYLNHPEGIMFSYLPDFKDELMEIYKKIKGPFFNSIEAQRSIDDVTNPLSNSINEKCSRIKAAFVSQFDDHLAKYYYIDGERGEVKKIALPRTLVKWDK